jgi:hypothetical protein
MVLLANGQHLGGPLRWKGGQHDLLPLERPFLQAAASPARDAAAIFFLVRCVSERGSRAQGLV